MRRFAVLVALAATAAALAAPGGSARPAPTDATPQRAQASASAQDWSFAISHVADAWSAAPVHAPVLVGVVDSGVNAGDPTLVGAVETGYDFVDGTTGVDPFGHGTLVADVIGARPSSTASGVCFWCAILPVRVLGANGVGSDTAIAQGIRWAADNGARVINLSIMLSGPDQSVADAVAYAEARGVVVVAAAGNDGSQSPSYPASLPGVIGVAAVDQNGALYGWSRSGSWVTVGAPGCVQTAAAPFCGTSAAAAFVSGVVALGISARPDAAAADLRNDLLATATREPDGTPVVDAGAFLHALVPAAPAPAAAAAPAVVKAPTKPSTTSTPKRASTRRSRASERRAARTVRHARLIRRKK
ncbi:MAG TPA: S8 family serine peptidase [Gaiellaceae bacterium]|nr:S8 family serine peptidase [Gaiellaceae bacterium]